MKPTLCSPLMSISHIQICYQLLQTHPSAHSLNPPICPFLKPTHPSATNPQPFCCSHKRANASFLPGDDCRTYGRLTDPKKTTQRMSKKNDFSLSIYIYNRKKCFEILSPCFWRRDFEGGFFGIGSTLIDAHTLSGQTEGLKVGCGWVGGGMGGFKEWADGRV